MREREGLGPLIVTAHLRHHIRDLLKLAQRLTQLRTHRLRLLDRDTRRQLHLDPDGTLIQRRKEIFSHRVAEHTRTDQDQHQGCDHLLGALHDLFDLPMVKCREPLQPTVMKTFLRLAIGHEGQAGNQQQRHAQRAHQGITHRIGHRREQLALDMLKSEKRQVSSNNN